MNIGKILVGWFGGSFEDSGLFETKIDAVSGICSYSKLHEIFDEYYSKKIKITIEIIEE